MVAHLKINVTNRSLIDTFLVLLLLMPLAMCRGNVNASNVSLNDANNLMTN